MRKSLGKLQRKTLAVHCLIGLRISISAVVIALTDIVLWPIWSRLKYLSQDLGCRLAQTVVAIVSLIFRSRILFHKEEVFLVFVVNRWKQVPHNRLFWDRVSKVVMTCLQIIVYASLDRNTLFQHNELKNIMLLRPTLKSLSSPWPSSIDCNSGSHWTYSGTEVILEIIFSLYSLQLTVQTRWPWTQTGTQAALELTVKNWLVWTHSVVQVSCSTMPWTRSETKSGCSAEHEAQADLELIMLLHLYKGYNSCLIEYFMKLNKFIKVGFFILSKIWYYWELLFTR
jgi:hypothetical protein